MSTSFAFLLFLMQALALAAPVAPEHHMMLPCNTTVHASPIHSSMMMMDTTMEHEAQNASAPGEISVVGVVGIIAGAVVGLLIIWVLFLVIRGWMRKGKKTSSGSKV
ncbi:hypothetical protein F5X98DRAFT_373236 [Xylaria grammica]|nr:hypothetical protein F5X98DRAFT_373236 [Xylaria grammica]